MKHIALAFCLLLSLPSLAATTLKLSTQYPAGTQIVEQVKQAAQRIAEQTNGQVKLKIYPGGVMGDDKAITSKIRLGQLDGAMAQAGALAASYKDIQIYNAPFVFDSYAEVDHARQQLDSVLESQLLEQGWKSFGFIDGGFAYILSQHPVRSLDDLRKGSVFIPANDPFSEKMARSFDINAIIIGYGDVLAALQTGAIDTLIIPPAAALIMQWFNHVDYVTQQPLIYTMGTLYISARSWNKLSEDQQRIVDAELRKTLSELDAYNRADNIAAMEALLNQGIEAIDLTTDEAQAIQNNSNQAISILIEQGEFSQSMYQSLEATLDEIR